MTQPKIIASAEALNTGEIYSTTLTSTTHSLVVDEPERAGGKDEGPAPGDYLCMSLASCKAITLRMYAQRKNWNLEVIKVQVDLVRAADMETGNNTFYCKITLTGDLDDEQRTRLLEIAKACPLHKLLNKPSDIFSFTD